jgi:hypothetical protein
MKEIIFNKGDPVDWDYLDSMAQKLLSLYGKGPFYVVKALPLSKDLEYRVSDRGHFQSLIISRDKRGKKTVLTKRTKKPVKFSAEFFRKLSLESLTELQINNAIEESEEIIKILVTIIEDSKIILKPKKLPKIKKIYLFCSNINGFRNELLNESFVEEASLKSKRVLLNNALGYSKEIIKILQNSIKSGNLVKIKIIYDYVKGVI